VKTVVAITAPQADFSVGVHRPGKSRKSFFLLVFIHGVICVEIWYDPLLATRMHKLVGVEETVRDIYTSLLLKRMKSRRKLDRPFLSLYISDSFDLERYILFRYVAWITLHNHVIYKKIIC
jgi:hypothetical protein